jgi:hypothetical protein
MYNVGVGRFSPSPAIDAAFFDSLFDVNVVSGHL